MRKITRSDQWQGLSKKAILKLLFLALLLLGVLWTTKFYSGQEAQSVKPTGVIGLPHYRWTTGESATYQLSYSSSSSLDFNVLFGDIKSSEPKGKGRPSGLAFSFETTVKGDLTSTILEQSRAAPKSLTMRILPKALSTIGHSQAQAAIVEAIKAHSSDKIALFMLINPLATVSEPTENAEEALKSLAFNSKDPEIAAMAQLALGAQARSLATASPKRAKKIVDRFIAEIKKSSSHEMTKQLLLALGNAGSSRALPEISELATSSSPDLRATALHALRFIDSPQAETMLIDALRSDLDSSVRSAAADALGYREMTEATFKAQKEIFSKDANVNVRLKVLDNLRKAQQAFPEVRHLIKKAASEDPSEEVRKAAKNIMAQYPEGYFK